jgi:sec-independent protein translocase protein TatA
MLPLAMFTGNPVEWAIIAGVVVLLFGGSKLAGFGKSLGEGIKEFKKATTDEIHATPPPPVIPQETPVIVGAKTEEK